MQEIQFDYFRGMEAEQYTFYRIPKILFTAELFPAKQRFYTVCCWTV